jgi:hypothetical protein
MTRTARSALVPLAVLVVLLGHPATAAAATAAAATSAAQSAGSGTWAIVATKLTSAPYVNAALTLTYAKSSVTPQYLWSVNTGTLPLLGSTYTLTTTSAAIKVEGCSTTWNESTGACTSGTITSIVTTLTSPISTLLAVAVPQAVGSRDRLKVTPTVSPTVATTVTLGVTVSRAQVRAATTLNS